jgi:hypothetical protein
MRTRPRRRRPLARPLSRLALALVLTGGLAACPFGDDTPAAEERSAFEAARALGRRAARVNAERAVLTSSDTTPGALTFTRVRPVDLTGDGAPELVVVAAVGPRYDSLAVRVEIRSPGDSVLFASEWMSGLYFKYLDRRAFSDSAVRARVLSQLDALVAFDATRPASQLLARQTKPGVAMREAIAADVAQHRYRDAHHLAPDAAIPPEATDEVRAATPTAAKVDSLYRELRGRRAFRFRRGGAATYIVVWSPTEQRFVTVYACC